MAGDITIYTIGKTGVLIFFVHTALVLMMSLDRMALVHSNYRSLILTFYTRRFFRIYPLSIAFVLAVWLFRIPAFPGFEYQWIGWGGLASNLALLQNITRSKYSLSVLWSLPFEVQMYAVLPLIFIILRRFRAVWVPVAMWASISAAIWLMSATGIKGVPAVLWYFPCFMGGIVAYRLLRERSLGLPFWMWPVLITGCVIIRAMFDNASTWLVCLLLGLATPQFLGTNSSRLRSFSQIVAKYSYGIYMSHSVVFWMTLRMGGPWWLKVLVGSSLSVVLPVLLFHLIEDPLIRFGRDFFPYRINAAQKSELATPKAELAQAAHN